jgi:DNA-binding CsgD family transcriptional regulator
MALLERERELEMVQAGLVEARSGHGCVVVVEGVAGIGKTALVTALCTQARDDGIVALTALSGELEQELPFSVVRQLFEPSVRSSTLTGAARLAAPVFDDSLVADATSVGAVVHGLYWVCSDLADESPLLLVIDDVHWVDDASLRFISYLARRITDIPIMLVLAGRPAPPGSGLDLALSGLTPRRLFLQPLSETAVSRLVREILDVDADDAFCRACATASGGNPFLLTEGLRTLSTDGVRPIASEAARVANLQPHAVTRAVLTRLAHLGPEATRLARALAVLGPVENLHIAAALADLTPEHAAAAGEALAAEDIVTRTRPISLRHPLVRAVIYADSTDLRRSIEHKRAAALLASAGVAPEDLVPHLLATAPESDPRIVEQLLAAARTALGRGAPEIAAACLRRALAEPPAAADRLGIMIEFAHALGMANKPIEAADVLSAAADLLDDPILRAEITLVRALMLFRAGHGTELTACYDEVRPILAAREAELLRRPGCLTILVAGLAAMESPIEWIDRLERIPRTDAVTNNTVRLIDASLAFCFATSAARSADETFAAASRAAKGELSASPDTWIVVNFASAAMSITDNHAEALDLLDRGIATAQQSGDVGDYKYLCTLRSHSALYAGRLHLAEESGRAALDLHDLSTTPEIQLAAAVLIDALVARGELAEAQAILSARGMEQPVTVHMLIDHFVLMARARLRWRQHRLRDALSDYQSCGMTISEYGFTNPGFAHWRAEAAQVLFALGQVSEARDLALENLELSRRFQAPGAIGIALRINGLIGDRGRLDTLAESVAILRTANAELELARSLTAQGAALRRAGHRSAALPVLREGLDLAARCGARPLAEEARAELVAAGARPRRAALTGPDALTASELRVARLAAADETNREIAQGLFVSLRTVEVHLTNTYRKLGVHSRSQLATALAGTGSTATN